MTEAEWLAFEDASDMLRSLRERFQVSDRKQRLVSVACCRHIWELIPDMRSRRAGEVAEAFAEGSAPEGELAEAYRAAQEACGVALRLAGRWDNNAMAAGAAEFASYSGAAYCVSVAYRVGTLGDINKEGLSRARRLFWTKFVQDIFGNPFRPVVVEPAWLTSDVRLLSEGIYQNRAFDRMPILADALQDTGCDNDDVLTHCRQPGQHVRGCWVVDLLTGRKRTTALKTKLRQFGFCKAGASANRVRADWERAPRLRQGASTRSWRNACGVASSNGLRCGTARRRAGGAGAYAGDVSVLSVFGGVLRAGRTGLSRRQPVGKMAHSSARAGEISVNY
jgi:hypothetical protein